MRIAIAQINSTGDFGSNLHKVKEFTRRAAGGGAEIVVFPEATMVAFGNDLATAARTHFTEWTESLQSIASSNQITVIAGGFDSATDNKVKNFLYTAKPDGDPISYQKIHLYDAFGYTESESVLAGEAPVVAEVANELIGFGVCYDIRFPKLFVENARRGAAVTFLSASWGAGKGKLEQWRVLAQARALDASSFIVACGQADPSITGVKAIEGAPTGIGHSLVVNPYGEILFELGAKEELKIIDFNPEEVLGARQATAVLENSKLGF
ncbi:nitrilase-related carbon-nitrogen hydrolase [Corynebacterium flavescens]|uniref:nitrilase-related carbon-nitrogen hydrolase n=1 Tax=Corynebacterium flavescens TaxID=28028 RepID=UPI003FD6A73A